MGSVGNVVLLSFCGALGLTLLVLACALPRYSNFWPLFTLVFHALSPVPYLISRRYTEHADVDGRLGWLPDAAAFATAGIVVSSFALPIMLAHVPLRAPTIEWGACLLVLSSNVVVLLTVAGLVLTLDRASDDWLV